MSSDVSSYVERLLAGKYQTRHVDNTNEFEVAVAKLIHGGIPREAAVELMNRAVGRPGSLDQWADHLVRVRHTKLKAWSS